MTVEQVIRDRAAARKAQETRRNAIFVGQFVLMLGYISLAFALLHGLLIPAAIFLCFGLQVLIAQQVWKDWR